MKPKPNLLKIFFLLAFCLGGVFFMARAAQAATWYANSSTGNDSGETGSNSSPYQTFTKAYNSAAGGDTVNLTGTFDWSNPLETGSMPTSSFIINKNLTVQGQGQIQIS